MDWTQGDVVLGLYEVRDAVHSGGMGVVHRVRHLGWQVDMAVKTPRPELVGTPEGRGHFEAEAGTWVGLGAHPHTVNCAYVRTIDGMPRVFAEWVDGGSLAQAVRGGALYAGDERTALARVLDIAVQTAWGLTHAHGAGLVHQDVKPANVMLDPDGTAKVTDFGLANARAANETERPPDMPVTASFGGMTPAYCSPEQAAAAAGARDRRLTTATDVWSWGVTVLEMFAGRRPTNYGQAAGEALETLKSETRLPIHPAVATLLRQCFTDDPATRPARLDELATTMTEVYREVVGTAYPRPAPKAARLLSDGLSNQALSLLDLGRIEEAEELWRHAIGADPHHLPSVYNFGLHRWRSGQETGEQLVSNVETARALDGDTQSAFLLGAVQLERHEDERAGELLREAADADPDSADIAAALAEWRERRPRLDAGHDVHAGHAKDSFLGVPMSAVATSADGGLVLSGDREGGLVVWTPGKNRRAHRTLTRRGSPVDAVATDAAGTLGVAVRRDGAIEMWDLANGRRRPGLMKTGDVHTLAVSSDGRYVAAGNTSGMIRIWTPDKQHVATLRGHTGGITSLALSQDGRRAVSASFSGPGGDGDGTVRSWDVFGGVCVAALTGPAQGTFGHMTLDRAAVSTDARCAVVAWWRGLLTLWDARQGVTVSEVPHRWRTVTSVAVASAGPTVVTTGDISTPVQAWDPTTGRCLRTLDVRLEDRQNYATTVSTDGRAAVLGSNRGKVTLRSLPAAGYQAPWCYARPRPAHELTSAADVFHERLDHARGLTEQSRFAAAAAALRSAQQVPGFARHPDLRGAWARVGPHGRRSTLLSASVLYEFDGDQVLTQPPTLAMREDGLIVATGRWTGEVDVWDFVAGERLHVFDRGEGGMAKDIQFAVAEQLLAVRTNSGTIRQLNLATLGKRIFTKDTGRISAFAVNPAGDRILIGDETGTLRLRNLPQAEILRTMPAHGGEVHAVALSPDGRYAATLGGTHPEANRFENPTSYDENEVHLWPVDADRPAWTLPSRSSQERLDFSADGQTLFLSQVMFTGAWDVPTGELRYSFRGNVGGGMADTVIAFGADGRLAATRDREGLRVWDTATGKTNQILSMPDAPTTFALSADGSFAVTGGFDCLLKVWDLRTAQCLRTLEGHQAEIYQLALSRDGTLLASTDLGSSFLAWELAWDFDFPAGD